MSQNMDTPSNPRHSSVDSTTIGTENSEPRALIRPRGFGFEGSKDCVPTITQCFKGYFVGPWPTFSDVPNEVKDIWFQKFSNSFRWEDEDTPLIRKNWEKICRKRLSDQLHRDRQKYKDTSPPWIDAEHWRQLMSHWNSEEFKAISASAKRNRTSIHGTHTGGSLSFSEHEDRAVKEHGPSCEYSEIFKRLHVFQSGPKKGEFIDDRSRKAMEDFTLLKEQYSHRSSSSSCSVGSSTMPTDKELFVEVAGGFKKGRAYGLGSEAPIIRSQLNDTTNPSPTMTQLVNKVAELEEKVKEKDSKYEELESRVKEKDNKFEDICKYLKQIAEQIGPSSLPPIPSSIIESDDDTTQ